MARCVTGEVGCAGEDVWGVGIGGEEAVGWGGEGEEGGEICGGWLDWLVGWRRKFFLRKGGGEDNEERERKTKVKSLHGLDSYH